MKMLTVTKNCKFELIYAFNRAVKFAQLTGNTKIKLKFENSYLFVHVCIVKGHVSWVGSYKNVMILGRFPSAKKYKNENRIKSFANISPVGFEGRQCSRLR